MKNDGVTVVSEVKDVDLRIEEAKTLIVELKVEAKEKIDNGEFESADNLIQLAQALSSYVKFEEKQKNKEK